MKDTIKSSEVSYFDLAYNITLFEHYPSSNNFASVKVKFYDGNNLLADKTIQVKNTENGMRRYFLEYEAG